MKSGIPKHLIAFLSLFDWLSDDEVKESFINYIILKYADLKSRKGGFIATLFCIFQILQMVVTLFIENVTWSFIMFKNYLNIAWRVLKKHKGYSLINILGLGIGLVCCIFILLYVSFELSFDSYHDGIDRIYLVGMSQKSESRHELSVGNMPPLAPTLKERFPQVEHAARVNSGWIVQVRYGDKVFKEQGLWHANPGVFRVLSIPFVLGDPESSLDRPNTAVMTERMVDKYFGDKDPMGETITVGDRDYEITGVLQDAPLNTEFKYDIIMSWKTILDDELHQGWHAGILGTICIVKLGNGVDAEDFEKQISFLPHEYAGEELKQRNLEYRNFLFPLKDIHLTSISGDRVKPSTNYIYVIIFSAVGGLILLIACMNFMNLATARSANRACEVGMRKVVGAQRRQIVWQFMGESIFIAFIALAAAVFAVLLLMPFFNGLARTQFSAGSILQTKILMGFLGLIFIVGIAGGSYPAFLLSAFRPASVLRGSLKIGLRGVLMRRILVVAQFTISIALIIATLIVYKQITYMKNRPLGFDKDQKLVIVLKGWEMMTENYETVKQEFLSHPSVINGTASSGVPGSMINRTWVYPSDEEAEKGQAFRSLRCDHDFTSVYGIELVAGRYFDKTIPTDTYQAFIINEAGVKAFGWSSPEDAIGKLLWDRRYSIVGIVKDFHWWGLQRTIEPMIMRVVPDLFRSITLTVSTTNLTETLTFIETKYRELFPGDMFEYFFVDSNFDLQYQSEERMGRIFRIFTALGLFIACLGLFGMASFIAEQRTKEIGIRKVMGASVSRIVILLSREFIRWVLAANVIAWPLAYIVGQKWLENFAYRTSIGWELFVLSALITLGIAMITVSYQSMKSATTNPVESLRYE